MSNFKPSLKLIEECRHTFLLASENVDREIVEFATNLIQTNNLKVLADFSTDSEICLVCVPEHENVQEIRVVKRENWINNLLSLIMEAKDNEIIYLYDKNQVEVANNLLHQLNSNSKTGLLPGIQLHKQLTFKSLISNQNQTKYEKYEK